MVTMNRIVPFALACSLLAWSGCGSDDDESGDDSAKAPGENGSSLPQGSEHVELDPADFTTRSMNFTGRCGPAIGNHREGDERVVVTVTNRPRRWMWITARVIYDVGTKNGQPIEKTYDWFAQDWPEYLVPRRGHSRSTRTGKVSTTSGSWEAGVGAEAGVIMPADPRVGLTYLPGVHEGEAEDYAEVLSLDESVTGRSGDATRSRQGRRTGAGHQPRRGGRSELIRFTKG